MVSHQDYDTALADIWQAPLFSLPQAKKQALLLPYFQQLHQLHQYHCSAYHNISQFAQYAAQADDTQIPALEALPYLAVRLFKQFALSSVSESEHFKTLYSSGTTGQTPAKVILDRNTSARQSKALVKILQDSLGRQRLPMLIIDSASTVNDRQNYSARGAGIQGLALFGRDHTYALNDDMQPDWPRIQAFVDKYQQQPVLIFGFTFMVWLHFLRQLAQAPAAVHLPHGILLHSGGWKKLQAHQVDNAHFKAVVAQRLGVQKVVNFYGMAEQVGSIFTECSEGHLHAPVYADVIVRDWQSLAPVPIGAEGLIQVLSVLPSSYPGHSLLTEDRGRILGEDDCPCGRKGRYFEVLGRLPKAEVRGCSDTHQTP